MRDVAIIGGGIIGLSCARELARRGLSVEIREVNKPGQASWAAAGILAPQSEVHEPSPMLDLCVRSFRLYANYIQDLGEVGFRRNGTLHKAFTESEARQLHQHAQQHRSNGLNVEEREDGVFFPDEGQVDNRKLYAALQKATAHLPRAPGEAPPGRAERRARLTILCTGAWSEHVFPVKGEMIALDAPPPRQVIFGAGGYIVPRENLTLVGATAEPHNADPAPSKQGLAALLAIAKKHGYEGAPIMDHWAGLRPGTPDEKPLLGWTASDTIVAAGHYRNGILLAPITAQIVAALVTGNVPPLDLAPFDPLRYANAPGGHTT